MKSSDTLLQAWERTLRGRAGQRAIVAPTGETLRTFGDINLKARDLERILEFPSGSVIAVQIGNHADWPAVFLACLRRALVVVPLDESMTNERRDAATKVCAVAAIITFAGDHLRVIPTEISPPATKWEGRSPSLLKLTSGTTAEPRAIRFRSEQLLADCEQICNTMGMSGADLNFGVIPISHSYGFSNLLTPLIARGVAMVASNDRTPRAVLEHLSRTGATVLPAMPVFYQAFCEIENPPALPCLRLCVSAGAPLSPMIARNFRAKFQLPIHSFYGASECGGICYDRDGTTDTDGWVGPPMNGVDLTLFGSETTNSKRIRVRSAAVGDGYFPESDPGKLAEGTFIPDDLVERAGNGFKIVGRISELINVAGKKVNPAEIEAHLRRCPGVRDVVVFGLKSPRRNEEVAACVVSDLTENDVLDFARKGLSSWQVPKRIFLVSEIPATERGKISRRELAERLAR